MGWQFSRLADLKDAVQEARAGAEREARHLGYRAYKSFGTCLVSCDAGGSAKPYESGEGIQWNYTLKQLREAVARIERDYPKVRSLALFGGFDGAEDVTTLLTGGYYEPQVSTWELDVWTREEQSDADDERASVGPYAGHQLSCHIFVCPGFNGCTRPPGFCDCDQSSKEQRDASDK